ncbi:hypothetical protein E2C01_100042 [Portunus trituberculatus]|uniref:Uncharacterized protein n=1 Tax=Portunus trituberculatus TaxID=210409 RepID=A0A5B7K5P3_PORTR|nr:hypothetical protein [Portunus trituberculatus]
MRVDGSASESHASHDTITMPPQLRPQPSTICPYSEDRRIRRRRMQEKEITRQRKLDILWPL